MTQRYFAYVLMVLLFIIAAPVASAETVRTTAADGTVVYGERYDADLPGTAPLIALFHQAGSNGRGEYGPLIDWLNGEGFRAIAWDQRSGGGRFGESNRTAREAKGKKGFCHAYPDIEAAIAHSQEQAAGAPLIVWGSSYSASLVWRAALDHADIVDGVAAFSTATGGALNVCGARRALPDLVRRAENPPFLAVWPESEKGQVSGLKTYLQMLKVPVLIIDGGVHGASTLVDSRTRKNMNIARRDVARWLSQFHGPVIESEDK